MEIKTYPKGSREHISPHFAAREFDCPCGSCKETKIDMDLLQQLEGIRQSFGLPVNISSGYRCQRYNKEIGGNPKSLHMQGRAADIWIEQYLHQPRKIAQLSESQGILGIGLYEGSLGQYFVHIDSRDTKFYWYSHQDIPRDTFWETVSVALPILRRGDTGETVKALQRLLSCDPDGSFGPATEASLVSFQSSHGLSHDGVCGIQSWKTLLGRG